MRGISASSKRCRAKTSSPTWNRARATLSKIPSLQELAQTSADATNTRIYGFSRDIDRRWIHRFLHAHPMDIDYKLLHYHLGGSFRPPRLWEQAGAQS
jgi:hypothetical protein